MYKKMAGSDCTQGSVCALCIKAKTKKKTEEEWEEK